MQRAQGFVHSLTAIHALGAVAVWSMAAFVAWTGEADRLATTPGARQLVAWTGRWLAGFFVVLGAFLAALAWGSWRRQPWSWPAAVVAYSIGVAGSLAEVAFGHPRYLASLVLNAVVVALLLTRGVRQAFARAGPS